MFFVDTLRVVDRSLSASSNTFLLAAGGSGGSGSDSRVTNITIIMTNFIFCLMAYDQGKVEAV